ncbi:hypothetical protein [Leptospira sp. GIMC2001]|uniref:hypothetical protein n=1 Tax=Leptospira sp. GIMC2001 TaxID=1513297 RepID=UPI00234B9BAB|nr:hypothetical protein [Leptospira sp. GIMC2001]WCL48682.1 hypothetical protein O4O04_15425 [Leptospira sp. GIMC2001]
MFFTMNQFIENIHLTDYKKSFLILCLIFITFSCASEDVDPDEEFRDQAILTYLMNSATDPIASCQESYQSALNCLSVAKEFPLPIVNESVLSSVFTSGQASNFNQLCSIQRSNEVYKNFTDRAFACNFNCQTSYWNAKTSESNCGEQLFDDLINASLTDRNTRSCIDSCIRVTGNTSIPEDRKSLYLLFQIL